MKPIIIALSLAATLHAAPVKLVDEAPVSVTTPAPGILLVDFGKVSFGNIEITPPAGAKGDFKVHFGEAFADGRINRKPPGC
jgi:alpha-L-rhamnosidase